MAKRKRVYKPNPRKRQKTTHAKVKRKTKGWISHSKKKKKVSTTLKNTIKGIAANVHNEAFPEAVYNKNYSCDKELANTSPVSQLVFSHAQRDKGQVAPYTIDALQFNPFNARKLLDAASVLFNAKPAGIDYNLGAGNFTLKGLKVHFQYCSWTMRMKNLTTTPYEFEVYHATAKFKQAKSFEAVFQDSINNEKWVGATPANQFLINLKPAMLSAVKEKYNFEVKKFTIAPGGEHKIFLKWKGTVNFEDHTDTAGTSLEAFQRNLGQSIMFIAKPILAIGQNVGAGTANKVYRVTNPDRSELGFAIEVKETYVVNQPAETLDANEGGKRALFNDYSTYAEGDAVRSTYLIQPNVVFNDQAA